MTHSWWVFVVDALAVFRLTRLFARDTITERLRTGRKAVGPVLLEPAALLGCEWCLSVWFGAGAVALTALWSFWPYVAAALAFSAVTGVLSERT